MILLLVTSIDSKMESSSDSLISISPNSTSTISEKLRSILLFTKTEVSPLLGFELIKVGEITSAVVKENSVLSIIPE